ncbi:uncharacterized protein LOC143265822 [Megachile rotundata]|uniref:uncharacterized protein LOC143265822 n=1 Tax=Megachile rotundata TaxID=143995 RepID=UPI003FD2544C
MTALHRWSGARDRRTDRAGGRERKRGTIAGEEETQRGRGVEASKWEAGCEGRRWRTKEEDEQEASSGDRVYIQQWNIAKGEFIRRYVVVEHLACMGIKFGIHNLGTSRRSDIIRGHYDWTSVS